jgi:CRP-like cAMP-binding protein
MPLIEHKQGDVICRAGETLQNLFVVVKGRALARLEGHSLWLEKSDVIGICDFIEGCYSHTYTAESDITVFSYTYKNFSTLEAMFNENAETASLLVNAACRMIAKLMYYKLRYKAEADRAYTLSEEIFPQYEQLCRMYAYTPKQLAGLSELAPYDGADDAEEWLNTYYTEVRDMDAGVRKAFFNGKPGITAGFIRKSAEDAARILAVSMAYYGYIKTIAPVFMNSDEHDLFAFVSELHINSVNIKGADAAVDMLMEQLTGLLSDMPGIDPAYYHARVNKYKEQLASGLVTQSKEAAPADAAVRKNLEGSLNAILEYSGAPTEVCSKFARAVEVYKNTRDKGSSEDDVRLLRRELTKGFYDIYTQVLFKSFSDAALPTVIKMFLNFGYVDAELAGYANADYLYSVADAHKGAPELGVYTIYEWLTAVCKGKKEPCRNDFDEDFPTYVRGMKASGQINEQEEARLLKDIGAKLRFEMENMFPNVNKITFGIISTFCPLFSEHNIQRKLDASRVRPPQIREALDEIRRLDYSAYYRETLYSNPDMGVQGESVQIHVEVLPDVILMPNAGIRGIMWQEIEGRVRTTPGRMFLPAFLQTDLKVLMMRLTGEFRWEMCKRIQGVRWNDLTDPSLTSDYCDYLQFFKTNRDLSATVKEAIKLELTRGRNNFKTVFTSNYVEWLQYESNGLPRLNKHARQILLNYCPFTKEIIEKLATNPTYSVLLNRYKIKRQQRIDILNRLIQKIEKAGKPIPKQIREELEFANK